MGVLALAFTIHTAFIQLRQQTDETNSFIFLYPQQQQAQSQLAFSIDLLRGRYFIINLECKSSSTLSQFAASL
jgi:hypothetical protein